VPRWLVHWQDHRNLVSKSVVCVTGFSSVRLQCATQSLSRARLTEVVLCWPPAVMGHHNTWFELGLTHQAPL